MSEDPLDNLALHDRLAEMDEEIATLHAKVMGLTQVVAIVLRRQAEAHPRPHDFVAAITETLRSGAETDPEDPEDAPTVGLALLDLADRLERLARPV